MNLEQMEHALDRIRSSPCMSDESRQAAQYANDLLRVFRQYADLEWSASAGYLYGHAQGIANELIVLREYAKCNQLQEA
jgi:hypothetical protein